MKIIASSFTKFVHNPEYVWLCLITIIAALLRFYKLGEWGFWEDEVITVRRVDVLSVMRVPPNSLSLWLTGFTFRLFGVSEWSARLVPALTGIFSIPLVYLFARRMVGVRSAFLAVLLLTLSPWHLYWSQNARFYIVLALFYTVALFAFYFAIEEDRPVLLLVSLFSLGLAMLERLSALLLIPVIVSYVFLLFVLPIPKPPGLRLRNLAIFFSPGILGGIVVAIPYLQDPSLWWSKMAWINNSPFWILAGVVYYVGIPAICIGGLGGLHLMMQKNRAALFLLLGALVPLLAVMAISLVQYTANRYVFITLTSWAILAAMATNELMRVMPKKATILTAGILLTLFAVPLSEDLLYFRYQNGNRDNSKQALAFIQQHRSPDDLVVITNSWLGQYYLDGNVMKMEDFDLAEVANLETNVWFVEDMNVQSKSPHLLHWIKENTLQVADMDVHVQARNYRMRVYLYDPARSSPTEPWAVSEKQ